LPNAVSRKFEDARRHSSGTVIRVLNKVKGGGVAGSAADTRRPFTVCLGHHLYFFDDEPLVQKLRCASLHLRFLDCKCGGLLLDSD
jgi:hypothetical protein